MVNVHVVRLDDGLPLPGRQHVTDAGYDLYAREDMTLAPGERCLMPTGIAIALPHGHAGFVLPRSGLAARQGVGVLNGPGLIDSGYRGELKVVLVNHDPQEPFVITRGDRIAQLVVQRVEEIGWIEVNELDGSDRGTGGHGSTGHR
ncbi:MAG TPA: dUTP diphosphatase [Acidimicrobiia bacterium]